MQRSRGVPKCYVQHQWKVEKICLYGRKLLLLLAAAIKNRVFAIHYKELWPSASLSYRLVCHTAPTRCLDHSPMLVPKVHMPAHPHTRRAPNYVLRTNDISRLQRNRPLRASRKPREDIITRWTHIDAAAASHLRRNHHK